MRRRSACRCWIRLDPASLGDGGSARWRRCVSSDGGGWRVGWRPLLDPLLRPAAVATCWLAVVVGLPFDEGLLLGAQGRALLGCRCRLASVTRPACRQLGGRQGCRGWMCAAAGESPGPALAGTDDGDACGRRSPPWRVVAMACTYPPKFAPGESLDPSLDRLTTTLSTSLPPWRRLLGALFPLGRLVVCGSWV